MHPKITRGDFLYYYFFGLSKLTGNEWLLFNGNWAICSAISWREQVNFPWNDGEVYIRNKSWKPECVGSFNMDRRILVYNVWRLIVFAPFLIIISIILLSFFLSLAHKLVHGRSRELLDRISWTLVELYIYVSSWS